MRPPWHEALLGVAVALALGASEAHAEPPPDDPGEAAAGVARESERAFQALMGAIDTLPRDAAELTAWLPDARVRLARAAADRSQTPWIRIRSLQLVLRFSDAVPEVLALSVDPDAHVRGAAIYALARVHRAAPSRLRSDIARTVALGLTDLDPIVRAPAARGLRWLVAPRRP